MARVLVVDDNHDMVDVMVELLTVEGHDCAPCYDGEEVLACVRRHNPDVVLLDLRMPRVDGFTAAKAIRDAYGDKRPILIAITAEYDDRIDGGAEKRAKARGFDYYLQKPPDHRALLAILKEIDK